MQGSFRRPNTISKIPVVVFSGELGLLAVINNCGHISNIPESKSRARFAVFAIPPQGMRETVNEEYRRTLPSL